jgi:urea transport system permease protein
MSSMKRWTLKGAVIACALWGLTAVQALTLDQAQRIATGETAARVQALAEAVAQGTESTAVYLQALADDVVKITEGQVIVVRDGQGLDAVTGLRVVVPEDAQDVMLNNRLRGEIDTALAALKLFSPDVKVRRKAALSLLKEPDASRQPLLDKALAQEQDAKVQNLVRQARAAALLGSDVPNDRLLAARELADSRQPETVLLLNQQLAKEQEPAVKRQIQMALAEVKDGLRWGERLGILFTGASLGSILLLVALGLAITYGLMGVINMAHGELMMIGAYATYVVQALFREHLPQAFDAYLFVAIPVAFMTSALVGAVMERTVIKHLYGRPLETLLATWGISLVLMQGVRSLFGAQNVGVENPSWMSGSLQVLPNLQLPWNRVLIIVFAAAVLIGVALLISKTRLGLFVRGVTQNRPMASCMGVNTARIDTYAFALGSGIAGLAGCALSQVGNVGPDLGQSYIVDAFMVVVLGGVGQLAGTVYAALGLGLANKLLEGWTGAVLAKIAVLVFIIVFIQKRPQGIFAMKGRSAEA